MSLITPFEVIKKAPVRFDFPTANLCDFISDVEEDLFDDKCLLKETYTKLEADLITYSDVPTYDGNTSYNDGDLVLLDGCIFVSLANVNIASPLNDTAWSLAPKFETTCYNTFWNKYLWKYLAFNIASAVLPYNTYQAGSKGLTKFAIDNTGVQTVNLKEYFEFKSQVIYDSERILRNMRSWMLENLECFPEMETGGCCTTTCNTAPRSRRIAWPK